MPELLNERAIHLARQVVADAIFRAQLNIQSLDPIVGQVVAAKLGDLAAVDFRADQLVEVGVGVVGPFRRGGEPQPERGDRAGGRQAVGRAGKVVAFVKDDEPKAVSQPLHVQIGRVVGRHRDRLDVVEPPPRSPISTLKLRQSSSYHWFKRSIVGVTIRVGRPARSIAMLARCVLPVPVGSTTTPRPP